MKTTRLKSAKKAAIALFWKLKLRWNVEANLDDDVVDFLVHVMKAEHARHARNNICRRKVKGE